MRRDELETAILEGLQHRLMDDGLTQVFCEEFTRLRNEANAHRNADEASLAKTERHINRLVQALMEGVPPGRIKEKLQELEKN